MEEIINEFSLFGDWEDRYSHLIELGKTTVLLDQAYKTDRYKVRGCASQVWLMAEKSPGDNPILTFKADSDAYIVKGLIALLLRIYSGKTPAQIKTIKITGFFQELGLKSHLSPSRSNGFFAIVQRIHELSCDGGFSFGAASANAPMYLE